MRREWLDRWDERQASRGDAAKGPARFALDAPLAFQGAADAAGVAEFCALADRAAADPAFFSAPSGAGFEVHWDDGWIKFPSSVVSDAEDNNTVWAKITETRSRDHALVVLHHWNATDRSPTLARFLAWQGITVAEMAMPWHLERRRPGASHADDILSPSLGRTLRSMRQAVLDGRRLVSVLRSAGYRRVSVLGMSLGSWVAGLIAANEPAVEKAALLLTAGSLADMVWTGRATRHIRASLEGRIELADLRRAWSPLDLENHLEGLVRPGLALQLVLAERDTVVQPELSERLVVKLEGAGAQLKVLRLDCGHYSLSLPPYVLRAGLRASRFLARNP